MIREPSPAVTVLLLRDMLTALSHSLRTPLAVILNDLQYLTATLPPAEASVSPQEELLRSARRANEIDLMLSELTEVLQGELLLATDDTWAAVRAWCNESHPFPVKSSSAVMSALRLLETSLPVRERVLDESRFTLRYGWNSTFSEARRLVFDRIPYPMSELMNAGRIPRTPLSSVLDLVLAAHSVTASSSVATFQLHFP